MAFASGRRPFDSALNRLSIRDSIRTAAAWGLLLAAGCAVQEPAPVYAGSGESARISTRPPAARKAQPPSSSEEAQTSKQTELGDLRPRLKPQSRQRRVLKQAEEHSIELPALLGLNHQAIAEIFGPPTNIERNGPSVVWNYSSDRCSLQIVFYGDIENQTYHALQYALTDSNGEKPQDAQRCLDGLQSRRRHGGR